MPEPITTLSDTSLEADICIIGAGAAGLVLAYELKDTGLRIVMLESGGEQLLPKDDFYAFESRGLPVSTESRARALGGTTTLWTGGWKPLDPHDFEKRDYLPHSGWPLTRAELDPYYDRAAEVIGAPSLASCAADPIASEVLQHTRLRILPRENWNFAKTLVPKLIQGAAVRILLEAPLVGIEQAGGGVRAHIKTPGGKAYVVHARRIVLAAGGIENARMLLLSNLGNEYGQVGRYYMDHPKGMAGVIRTKKDFRLPRLYSGAKDASGKFLTGFELTPRAQERLGALNSYVQLRPRYSQANIVARALAHFSDTGAQSDTIELRNFMEQAPDPENRITLSDSRDALGNRRAAIAWSIGAQDQSSLRALHQTLAEEFRRLGFGELESPLLGSAPHPWPVATDASHHLGTTRMGNDPHTSVVDADCALHAAPDIFIAGSSLFPTGGNANPTATLLALSVRLADHLKTLSY